MRLLKQRRTTPAHLSVPRQEFVKARKVVFVAIDPTLMNLLLS
jgi:hypothetical protein